MSLHIFLCAYCKAHTQHSSLCHGYTVAVTWPTAQGGQSKQKVPTNSSMAQAQQSGIAWKVHVRPQSATSQCDTVQGCKGWAAVAGREARASASSRMVRPGSPLLDVSTDQSPTAPRTCNHLLMTSCNTGQRGCAVVLLRSRWWRRSLGTASHAHVLPQVSQASQQCGAPAGLHREAGNASCAHSVECARARAHPHTHACTHMHAQMLAHLLLHAACASGTGRVRCLVRTTDPFHR